MSLAFKITGTLLCVFVLFGVNTTELAEQSELAMFALLGLILVFLSCPFAKKWQKTKGSKAGDIVLCLLTVCAFGYVFVQSEPLLNVFWADGQKLGDRAGSEAPIDCFIALIGVLLVLEATRRAIGNTLPILVIIFIVYAFTGPNLPDWLFPHRGFDWERIVSSTYLQSGVFTIALKVMYSYVFPFVIFGTLLEQTGATAYVINLAQRIFSKSTGGPAKVAVVSSGLMGSLSGSAVANTATTGTFTIPLMKSSGFKPEQAAGIEAAASSGGALMPPIMGAGAYMMLELIDTQPAVTLLQILRAALIPALLYYFALLLTVHFQSKKIGAASTAGDAFEKGNVHHYQGYMFFGAFLLLIVLLFFFSPFRSVTICLAGILIASWFSPHTRITPQKLMDALVKAAKGGVSLVAAASCVGIILGIVTLTGIGGKLPGAIIPLAQDNVILALILLMVSTIILGMGLPSAVCYLLMATMIGSVLESMETATLAAHLFIFYFGMMSMVTPPVALAAYTAAAIAAADVMKSGLAAFRFALVGFALPFAFVLRPELLMLDKTGALAGVIPIVLNVGITVVAIIGLAAGVAGFAGRAISMALRLFLVGLALTIFFMRFEGISMWIQIGALVGISLIVGTHFRDTKEAQAT